MTQFTLWTERAGYLLGQGDANADGTAPIVRKPDGSLWTVTLEGTPVQPKLAVGAGGAVVAVSALADGSCRFVPEAEWTRFELYKPPVLTPTIISGLSLPPVPPNLPPAWFGFWFNWQGRGGIAPGNLTCSLSPATDTRPFIGQLSRWPEEYAGRRVVGGYLGSEYEQGEYYRWLEAEIAECKARNVPLYLFCDSPTHTERVKMAVRLCQESGVEPRPLVHVRWTQTDGAYLDRLRAWSRDLGAQGCVFAYHFAWTAQGYAISKEQFAEQMAALFQLWSEQSWKAVLGFSWDRIGGVTQCPELIPYAESIAASTPSPEALPPVVVKPEPVGPPNKPTGVKPYRPGRGQGSGQAEKPSVFSKKGRT